MSQKLFYPLVRHNKMVVAQVNSDMKLYSTFISFIY